MLLSKLTQFWSAHPKSHTHYIIGLSGGIDSVALCQGLIDTTSLSPSNITLVYVNHNWRPEAKDEEHFVLELGKKWGIHAIIKQAEGANNEDLARQARYRLFAEVAQEMGATAVLTAHHADDQAETFLLHLLRGSGLAGLTGMAPIAPYPLPEFTDLQLIRPLLAVSKAEIEAYAQSKNLAFMVDQTNQGTRYTRNKIRHELIPILESYNINISAQLGRTAALLADDYDFIEQALIKLWPSLLLGSGEGWLRLSLSNFVAQSKTTQRHLLRHITKSLLGHTQDLTFEQIHQAQTIIAQQQTGLVAKLPHNIMLSTYYDSLVVTTSHAVAKEAFDAPQLQHTQRSQLLVPSVTALRGGWQLKIERCSTDQIDWHTLKQDPYQAIIALPETHKLALRGRLPGDRFQPFAHNSSKKLKDWFIARKIPSVLRDHWPLVINQQNGEILWVAGQNISQKAAVERHANKQTTAVYLQLQSALSKKEPSNIYES